VKVGSFIRLPSSEIYTVDSRGDGLPHVLVHGLGASHTSWLDVFDALAERNRVISVDLPGYGFSPPIARHDIDSLRDVMIEFLEHLTVPVRLIGNSMGGLISEMVASQRPDLVTDLVLITPASPAPPGTRPPRPAVTARLAAQSIPGLGRLVMNLYRRALSSEERVDALLSLVCADPRSVSESTRTASLEMVRRRDSMPWSIRALTESTESIRKLYLRRSSFKQMIAAIEADALVLTGSKDTLVPPAAIDALRDLRPDWTFSGRVDLGHAPQLEDPNWVLDEIDSWVSRSDEKARAT
jgi:pimeloyl-ACP methyl ester carboxylesterase